MELVTIDNSRLTVLVNVKRARGQLYLPDAMELLVERYGFVTYPKIEDLVGTNVYEFKMGKFNGSAIDSLTIYQDGISIVSGSDTTYLDNVYRDLVDFMSQSLNLELISTHKTERLYDSAIIVRTEGKILHLLDELAEVCTSMQRHLSDSTGTNVEFLPFGLSLAADTAQIPGLKPSKFRLERREGIDFSFNQYFSSAPLRTKEHFEILEMIDLLT